MPEVGRGGLKKLDNNPPVLLRGSLVDCVLAMMGEVLGILMVLVRRREGLVAICPLVGSLEDMLLVLLAST